MICKHCSTPLPDDSRFCLSCGADLSNPTGGPRSLSGGSEIADRLREALAGRYDLMRMLGRGGMGAVFLAKDLRLEREVAVKVLPFDLARDERFVGRFLREARTAARLEHPNIVPIYAVESQDELHYFVMRFVNGKTVDQLIESGRLPIELVRRVIRDAALALGHAHRAGVVHRDVKPSNIMIDEGGRVLLADFGISKALESATQFTGTGQLVGTPHYMSPEQALGREVDGRSDQYSLAVVAYEMLAGQLPFEAGSAHLAIYKHIHEEPTPLTGARPDVPADLVHAIARALAKTPDERYRSMEDFASAFDPDLEHPSLEIGNADATATIDRANIPKPPRRSRKPLMIAGIVAVLLAGAVGTWAANRPGAPATVPPPPAPVVSVPVDAQATAPADTTRHAPPQTVTAATTSRAATSPTRTRPQPAPPPPAAVPAVENGFLSVDADPYGTVSVDGVDIGDTPVIKYAVRAGKHTVQVSREGYKTWSESIPITAGNTIRRHVQLITGP